MANMLKRLGIKNAKRSDSADKPPGMAEKERVFELLKHNCGGRLVEDSHQSQPGEFLWECDKKHIQRLNVRTIGKDPKCKICKSEWQREVAIYAIKDLVRDRHQGRCLSDKIPHGASTVRLRFRCKSNHVFELSIASVRHGTWCPECRVPKVQAYRAPPPRPSRIPTDTLPNVIIERYCSYGHRFPEHSSNWIGSGRCARCNEVGTLRPKQLGALAKKHGLRTALTKKTIAVDVRAKWLCKDGHIFTATPQEISGGKACSLCLQGQAPQPFVGNSPIRDLEDLQTLARTRGGSCLAKAYEGSQVKVLWRCADGHEWMAPPTRIAQGHWCLRCYRERNASAKNAA